MTSNTARASLEGAPSSPTPTGEASLSYGEQLYRQALRLNPSLAPSLRRAHDGSLAVETLVREPLNRDPDITLLDDSVTVSAWSTNDESVHQAIEMNDGTIYAITNHSRGYTGDDRFSVAAVTDRGFRDIPLPKGVEVVELESSENGQPYVAVERAGFESQFAAIITTHGLRLRGALKPQRDAGRSIIPSVPRSCSSDPTVIRAHAAVVSHGVSQDRDVDERCAAIGNLGFVSLSQGMRQFCYVVDSDGFHRFSTWRITVVGRDAILFSNSTNIEEGESTGFRDSYVLLRSRSARGPSPPSGV